MIDPKGYVITKCFKFKLGMRVSERKRKVLEPWSPSDPNTKSSKRTENDGLEIIERPKKTVKKTVLAQRQANAGKVEEEVKVEPSKDKNPKKPPKAKNLQKSKIQEKDAIPRTSEFKISLTDLVNSADLNTAILQKAAQSGPIESIEVNNNEYCSIQEDSIGVLKPLANSMAVIPSVKSFKIVNNSWRTTYLGKDGVKDFSCALHHTPLITTLVVKGLSRNVRPWLSNSDQIMPSPRFRHWEQWDPTPRQSARAHPAPAPPRREQKPHDAGRRP